MTMTPLRFRAWHPVTKVMIPDTGLPHTGYRGPVDTTNHEYMQSTGLVTDGEEIFEGDILQMESDGSDEFLAVVWDAEQCCFAVENVLVPRQPLYPFVQAASIN